MVVVIGGILAGSALMGIGVLVFVVLRATERSWRVRGLWRLLMWDARWVHVIARPHPRLDAALQDVWRALRKQALVPPPGRAFVLRTFGRELPDVMFGFADLGSCPALLFLPEHRLAECDDADLRIIIAHEYGHLIERAKSGYRFLANIRRLEGEDFCHGVAARLYGAEQTLATLKKLGVAGLCDVVIAESA